MRLPSRTTALVVLVLLLAIGGGLGWQFYQGVQPDLGAVGGTVLVYKVDPDAKGQGGGHADAAAIAEALRRRFVFAGLRHVQAHATGADEVEIRIPRVGDHDADVQSIKETVAAVGQLEFRMLANSGDDTEAIDVAQRMINDERETDTKLRKELADAQADGLPPPGPREADGQPRVFRIDLASGQTSTVSYRWIELGNPERRALNLDHAPEGPAGDRARQEALRRCGDAVRLPEPLGPPGDQGRFLLQGALFYVRECQNRNLTEDERRKKGLDFYVLARDPELDPATAKPTPNLDGSFLASASADRDSFGGRPFVSFSLTAAGAELFGALTRKNVSEVDVLRGGPRKVRHLAIILDGQVMTAPTIHSEIRGKGSITGLFSDRQVAAMVSVLRAGALPGTLLPRPIRETVVQAGHGR
jgi:preprotein translocase subunit SecD